MLEVEGVLYFICAFIYLFFAVDFVINVKNHL